MRNLIFNYFPYRMINRNYIIVRDVNAHIINWKYNRIDKKRRIFGKRN